MLKIDLHIHTIHSGHAFGTIYEIGREAARKGMNIIAITDHGPSMPDANTYYSLWLSNRAPRSIEGVKILWGCEANIISPAGELDIEHRLQDQLDLVLVGLHQVPEYEDQGFIGNTKAFQNALISNNVNIISHITELKFTYDIEKVLLTALEYNVLPEINLSTLRRNRSIDDHRRIIDIVRHHNKKLIVNSDAHFIHEIGDDSILNEAWEELGLSEDLLLNNHPAELLTVLGITE